MVYKWIYRTPDNFDDMLMNSDGEYLTGLWFVGSKDSSKHIVDCVEKELPIFKETSKWLDIYFSGKEPNFTPSLHMVGTPFQTTVWKILQQIPYGKTITYGEIAYKVAQQKGISKMSAQAIGGAVGHNGISIIIPCHRVVGTNGSLTGYAGGIDRKIKLLSLEKVSVQHYFIPKKGSAL